MQIKNWLSVDEQFSRIGKHHWSVARLIRLSSGLKPFDAPIDCLNLWSKYELTMRGLVMHCKAIQDADLNYPIILDEDGEIMDGRHRIMKAIMLGEKTIKAVRFDENPAPCRVDE